MFYIRAAVTPKRIQRSTAADARSATRNHLQPARSPLRMRFARSRSGIREARSSCATRRWPASCRSGHDRGRRNIAAFSLYLARSAGSRTPGDHASQSDHPLPGRACTHRNMRRCTATRLSIDLPKTLWPMRAGPADSSKSAPQPGCFSQWRDTPDRLSTELSNDQAPACIEKQARCHYHAIRTRIATLPSTIQRR